VPLIQFPNVPAYAGVPALVRPVSAAIASSPVIAIGLGAIQTILGSALQQTPRWGIFDSDGNQLGINATSSLTSALTSQLTGATVPTLSTLSFEFIRETRVSDFPVEEGGFASYNKVQTPANPVITLALAGSESDRTNFLTAIDAACISTDLYSLITPEINYVNYSIERYRYARRASAGATLLIVEVSLKEIRQVTASFATPIVNPQNPAAAPQVSNGMTQPTVPQTSVLQSIASKLGIN
jgi:hypothetical protein